MIFNILIPRKIEDRKKRFIQITNQKIQKYIEEGCEGNLHLENTSITSLPDNLIKVKGGLYIINTSITSLPNNLQITDNLILYNSLIKSLPDNLRIGSWLYLYNTPLSKKYNEDQIRNIIESKGGCVNYICVWDYLRNY